MIADIRGTHGSGKSYLMSSILKMGKWQPIIGEGQATKKGPVKVRHLGYENKEWDAAVVGHYPLDDVHPTGGCDLLFPEEVVRRTTLFSQEYSYVFLEGILVSHTFGRYSTVAQELPDYHFFFLDTPLKTCLARVRARNFRSQSDTKKEFNPFHVTKDWSQIWLNVRRKCLEAGHNVHVLDYRNCLSQLLEEMGLHEYLPTVV